MIRMLICSVSESERALRAFLKRESYNFVLVRMVIFRRRLFVMIRMLICFQCKFFKVKN